MNHGFLLCVFTLKARQWLEMPSVVGPAQPQCEIHGISAQFYVCCKSKSRFVNISHLIERFFGTNKKSSWMHRMNLIILGIFFYISLT